MYVYLFEVKSVQSYLFSSGKLKDVIAASERLDRLVDETDYSTLNQVLTAAGIDSNLLDTNKFVSGDTIGFIRCKGGAFYAWCENKEPLAQLRGLWLLTVQQLFPSLDIVDALVDGDSLSLAMKKGHAALAASRNSPSLHFPLAFAPCDYARRTGLVAVPLSRAAQREAKASSASDTRLDLDTEHHRQAYQLLELRGERLIDKVTHFGNTNSSLPDNLDFPLDTEDFPAFRNAEDGRAVIRDLALIHIDGNGLGLLLRGLQNALENQPHQEYAKAFRQFSTALANATQIAACKATEWLYEQSSMREPVRKRAMLPMRPIVLGGDDLTLFCQADLALGFATTFCLEFETSSRKELASLYQNYLKSTKLKPYLTASGGILYHKANHPFITCHHLVEGLCDEAKRTTKRIDANTGPAALAFYRLGTALAEDIATLRMQSQQYSLNGGKRLTTSLGGYLVKPDGQNTAPNLLQLKALVAVLRKKLNKIPLPLSVAKLRQMATELARGNTDEAERIFTRAMKQLEPLKSDYKKVQQALAELNQGGNTPDWHWSSVDDVGQPSLQSWLSDMLIYAHFNPESKEDTDATIDKEAAHG